MRSIGITTGRTVEIISAYAASAQPIPAVPSSPGWFVVGSLYLPVSSPAQLEAIGFALPGVAMHVRLFDLTGTSPVTGSVVTINTPIDTRVLSGILQLAGNRTYQIQAEAIGPTGFAMLKSAQLV